MKRGRRPRPMLAGQRAAIFGLLLCGQSTFMIGNMLGFTAKRIRDELPPDWMPLRHGHRRKPKLPRPPRKRLDKAAIASDFQSGWHTLQEIADRHGCTREYVRQVVSRAGIGHRTHGASDSPEALNEALQRYLKALRPGVTSSQAEGLSGVSHKEAVHAAHTLGFAPPKFVRAARVQYQAISAFYEANRHLTGKQVAEHFDTTQATVSKALRVMNVRVRRSGWKHSEEARSRAASRRWGEPQRSHLLRTNQS